MNDVFYAVQHIINGRSGCLPSTFLSKDEAVDFALHLEKISKDADVETKVRLYEVKEITY